MKLLKASYEIIGPISRHDLWLIEFAGRTCYNSTGKITKNCYDKFIRRLIRKGHTSVLEHAHMSVRFLVDRGISHELVRHRHTAYSQQSTRYVRQEDEVEFIIPPWAKIKPAIYTSTSTLEEANLDCNALYLLNTLLKAETAYKTLLPNWTPEQARSILPNATATRLVMTTNVREWRQIFELRCSPKAHPQMQEVMVPLRDECIQRWPCLFEDLADEKKG